MNYGEVLTRAWKIVWKFKILWIFGIFASCGTGSGGGNGGNNFSYQYSSGDLPPQLEQFVGNIDRFANDLWWIFGLFICLMCVLIMVAIFLSTIGRIALIKGTLRAEEGAERMGFMELFNASTPYFWRVFGLSLLLFFVFFVAVVVAMLVFMGSFMFPFGLGLVCLPVFCLLFCLMIPVICVISVILEQAYIAIVVEDRGVADGLSRGWEVAKSHWEPMLVMGIILILGAAIIGFIIAVPIMLITFPLFFIFGISGGSNITPLAIGGICFLLYLPVLIVAGGILKAYVQSAWTLTFLRVTGRGPNPEIVSSEPEAPLPPLEPENA